MSPTGAQLACDWCLGKHLTAPLWQEMKAALTYVLLVTRGLQPVKGRLANSNDLNVPPQPPSFFQALCQYISYHLTVSTEDIRDNLPVVEVVRLHIRFLLADLIVMRCNVCNSLSQRSLPTWGSTTIRNEPDCNVGLSSYTSFKPFVRVIFLINCDVLWLK